ncbi:DUF2690 domain-containing protein [Rhizocola hellebori]|uniref:DUF2690 domain-containing protein n=1 Tax=Rhizocola hellebori TaxID=1392758 RepID=UPI001941CB13|nr:DUF2690 domain-containing protein [Rhizocola hellebori]
MRRTAFRLFLITTTVLGSAAFTAGPANAGGCYGSSCNGRNPQGLCSADARTAKSVTTPYGVLVELRYSPSCRAAWGRILNAYTNDVVVVDSTDGRSYTATVRFGKDAFTLMVNDIDPLQAHACGGATSPDFRCTDWY